MYSLPLLVFKRSAVHFTLFNVQVQQDGGEKDFNKLPQLHLPLTRPQDQGTSFILTYSSFQVSFSFLFILGSFY